MNNLMRLAHRQGVTVYTGDPGGERQACYMPEHHAIVIRKGLTYPQQREALAHELGHVRYGHGCSSPKTEAKAWKHALVLLFGDGSQILELERQGYDMYQIAEELDVTVRALTIFRDSLLHTDYGIYVGSRMGRGQYYARQAETSND